MRRCPIRNWTEGGDLTSLDNWLQRADVGMGHVLGDLASEVLYPIFRIDADQKPLSGANNYVLYYFFLVIVSTSRKSECTRANIFFHPSRK